MVSGVWILSDAPLKSASPWSGLTIPVLFASTRDDFMIISTTHAIEGRQITAYLDIVSAESVQGVNVIRDMFAGMRDFFGGRSQTLERALKEARIQATDEIRERARALQADAVVGVDFEISMPGGKGGMVVVFATGTAVKLR